MVKNRHLGWKATQKRKSLPYEFIVSEIVKGVQRAKKTRLGPKWKKWRVFILCLLAGGLFFTQHYQDIATAESGTPLKLGETREANLNPEGSDLQMVSPRDVQPRLPKNRDVILLTNQQIYGYSSTPDQTDSSPYITANGSDLRNLDIGIRPVANNCYPFGTVVNINDISYTILDRMNSRYGCEVWDIWFGTRQEALSWGSRTLAVKIIN